MQSQAPNVVRQIKHCNNTDPEMSTASFQSLAKSQNTCPTSQKLADVIASRLNAAQLVHADESGLHVAGKLHWPHIAANEIHTWYGVHGKHGILASRTGVLVHDCWTPYWFCAGHGA